MLNSYFCAALVLYLDVAVMALPMAVEVPAQQSTENQTFNQGKISTSQQSKPLKAQLQAALDGIVKSDGVPGATMAIVLPDSTVIDLASGFEDADTKTKLKVGAQMFCGSTGKTFVSAVALQLVAEGKLSLDELASKYLTEKDKKDWFADLPNSDKITIRSLMNHTSGLPRYLFQESYLEDLKANPMKARTPQQGLQALHKTKPVHEFGKGWSYSDSNYLVLGLIIERVAKKSYYDLANQRLLRPLKLKKTYAATQAKLPGLVQGHVGSNNFFGLPKKTVSGGSYAMNPVFEWCGGGFVTNSNNMARWIHALHTGKVLKKTEYAKLIDPVGFRDGQPNKMGYGLGSFVWQSELGPFYGHAGIMPGYLTQVEHSAKHKLTIAIQTNSDEGLGRNLHKHIQTVAKILIANSK